MSGLSKLGTSLTAVFVVSLVALFVEIFYVLWRRQVFRRHIPAVHRGDQHHPDSSSKELLYFFFCLKTQSRVEPSGAPTRGTDRPPPEDQMEVIDVFKLREMYGPSRVLFTIKEEEREGLDSLSAEKNTSLQEVVEVAGDKDVEVTPFSTPCASPLYFTPSASPVREMKGGVSADERV